MSKIELRLSLVEPPAPDSPRTFYRDLSTLPDTVQLGITMRYFNLDDVDLYFRVTGSAPGYTFDTVDLGLLESGKWVQRNLDELATRAKPDAELTESIKLILRAYTDAAYTNLKWTHERTVTIVWIDSSDPSYTVDVLNNFDDGTVQGWEVIKGFNTAPGYPKISVETDEVRSPPYALRMMQRSYVLQAVDSILAKSFRTPDRHKIYAVFDVKPMAFDDPATCGNWSKRLWFQRDLKIQVWLGGEIDEVAAHYTPFDKWIRVVIPLPRNKSLKLWIRHGWRQLVGVPHDMQLRMDDFKIISRD